MSQCTTYNCAPCRHQTLAGFLRALLNDLSYLMDDSFDRIADVQSIAASQANPQKWAALSANERATKERFKQSQVRLQCHMCDFTLACSSWCQPGCSSMPPLLQPCPRHCH